MKPLVFVQVVYPRWIRIWSFGFCGRRKTGEHGEKPSEQGENQQQTRPTSWYDTGSVLNPATLVRGERTRHCAIPAPQNQAGARGTTTETRFYNKRHACRLSLSVCTRNPHFIEKHNSFPDLYFSSITIHVNGKWYSHYRRKCLSIAVKLL